MEPGSSTSRPDAIHDHSNGQRRVEGLPEVLIPDHRLVRRIGRGSYGEVWLARSSMGSYRAVKVVDRKFFKDERPYAVLNGGDEPEVLIELNRKLLSHDQPGDTVYRYEGEIEDPRKK